MGRIERIDGGQSPDGDHVEAGRGGELAQAGKLGATMGAAGSFKEFGDMIGPLLVGFLSQALGLGTGFVICGVLGLASVLFVSRTAIRTEG